MQFSKWCHIFKRENISALVHSLTLSVVYVPTKELKCFMKDLESGGVIHDDYTFDLLNSQGFIVSSAEADELYFSEIYEKLRSDMTLELLYLLVTDGCNLKCSYCFEETPEITKTFKPSLMNSETVKRALDLFASQISLYGNPEKNKVIHLYGGEPLVNRSAVYDAIDYTKYLKSRGILPASCQLAIVTNGVLLNDEDAHRFADNKVIVGLSVDGPASITNRYRLPKKNDLIVFDEILRSFRILKKHGVSIGLSVTLTPDAVNDFDNFLKFFTEGEFSQVDGVSLNLLHYNPNIFLPDDYYQKAVACQIKAFEVFRRLGIYEERMMRKVRSFVNQEPMYADCGVVGRQLVIAPDGRIGVCQDFVKPRKYFPCSVYDSSHNNLLETLFNEWKDRTPFNMSQCLNCPALAFCGGGCPASAELKTGNRYNLDERACYHSKQVLEWLVWDAFEQLKLT